MKRLAFALSVLSLTACSTTYMPQGYSTSADNNVALMALRTGFINVGKFEGPARFDNSCHGGGRIAPPKRMSFGTYIQMALADELKVAGMLDENTPRVTLTGVVETLAFSTQSASWDIGLRVSSSNGKSILVREHFEFSSASPATNACKRTAEAYVPAVRDILGKLVKSPDFKALVTPSRVGSIENESRHLPDYLGSIHKLQIKEEGV
jgi:hypothetical protein